MHVSESALECTWKSRAAGCSAGRLMMFRPVGRKQRNANGYLPLGYAPETGQSAALAGIVGALFQLSVETESGRYNGRAGYGRHDVASQLRGAGQSSCAVNDVTLSS